MTRPGLEDDDIERKETTVYMGSLQKTDDEKWTTMSSTEESSEKQKREKKTRTSSKSEVCVEIQIYIKQSH